VQSEYLLFSLDLFQAMPEVWENLSWGTVLPIATPKKFLHGVRVFVRGYLRVIYDLLSSIFDKTNEKVKKILLKDC